MSHSYWNKFLVDGTIEAGDDNLIEKGMASWTKGRQDIVAVSMYYANVLLFVSYEKKEIYEDSFHQTDLNLGNLVTGESIRYGRCISAKTKGCNSYLIEGNPGAYRIKLGKGLRHNIPQGASTLRAIIDQKSQLTVEFR